MTATLSMETERLIINNGHNFGRVIDSLDTKVRTSGFSTFTLEINSLSLKQCLRSFPCIEMCLSELKGLFSLWKELLNK